MSSIRIYLRVPLIDLSVWCVISYLVRLTKKTQMAKKQFRYRLKSRVTNEYVGTWTDQQRMWPPYRVLHVFTERPFKI